MPLDCAALHPPQQAHKQGIHFGLGFVFVTKTCSFLKD
jgi:hypothetical protein